MTCRAKMRSQNGPFLVGRGEIDDERNAGEVTVLAQSHLIENVDLFAVEP